MQNMAHSYVTISVDDGHPADLRMADLLDKYKLKATFYIPAANPEREVIGKEEIVELSRHFEVGGHTMSHLSLKSMANEQAWLEISTCKKWLEDLSGREVYSFCYPQGKFDKRTAKLVEQAGFAGARTCLFNLNDFPHDPFMWGVSTHAYSHPAHIQVRHALIEKNFRGVWNYLTRYKGITDWSSHFLFSLDSVCKNGGIAHLFLHSWEIDQLGKWKEVENVFARISEYKTMLRVTNGELFRMLHRN
jgi:peptidoglycan/xylan/chitin deacetylase (PgdA/CDA1 family)